MKLCFLLFLFTLVIAGCASNPDHLSKDSLKDFTGMLAHKRWLDEIGMVERELGKVNELIQTTRLLIKQRSIVDENDIDGDIENYSTDLSRYEYEKIDLLKELDGLKGKL